MNCTQTFNPVVVQSQGSLPTVIVLQISTWEDQLLENVKQYYGNEVDGHLKQIRRVLPITKTKMKWDHAADIALKKHKDIQRY